MATSSAPIASLLSGDLINIYVGPKRKEYKLHKNLMREYPWFDKRMDILRKGYSSNHIYLPNDDPAIFELFINWLYRNALPAILTGAGDANELRVATEIMRYVALYIRAGEWEILELQNLIIDRLIDIETSHYNWLSASLIKAIYDSTSKGSPLRTYVIDSTLYILTFEADENDRAGVLETHVMHGNVKFVLDCYEALFQQCAKSKVKDPKSKRRCLCHEHLNGEKCK